MGKRKTVTVFFLALLLILNAAGHGRSRETGSTQQDDTALEDFSDTLPGDPSEAFQEELGDDFSDSTPGGNSPDPGVENQDTGNTFSLEDEPDRHLSQDQTDIVSNAVLTGHIKLSSACNIANSKPPPGQVDFHGLSRLKSELFLEFQAELSPAWKFKLSGSSFYDAAYSLNNRGIYTQEVLDTYETDTEFRETYIEGTLTEQLDIKIGRQIVVWGKSDNIRVTDLLNPLNLTEPGITDLEDLRLPVFMTKIDYYIGDWGVSAIAIHEKRFHKLPPFGSDFFPGTRQFPPETIPSGSLSNSDYALALNGTFTGWDLALYYADVFDHSPHLFLAQPDPALYHAEITMFGADINLIMGNWLFKFEGAFFDGVRFSDVMDPDTLAATRIPGSYSLYKLLLGLEYSGFTDTTLSIEGMNSHVNHLDSQAEKTGIKQDRFQGALRLTKKYLNDRFNLILLASIYGEKGQDGAMYRITGEYDLTDDIRITGGMVWYNSGDLESFQTIGANDRVYLDIKLSF